LKEAGLVSPEREGQTIRYRLEISAVEEAMAFLMDIVGTGEAAEVTPVAQKEPRR
jgi:DNA-binding transcriptional ArsR family regulator